ncbi:MAG: response regulator [Cytophagaceae bacterium]
MEKMNCILLVDDDKVNNFISTRILKKMDICKNIRTCLNGEEALLYLAKHCCTFDNNYPDLIILDNNMPEMNGIEFLESFNKIDFNSGNHVKVVVLTASSSPKDEERLKSQGIYGFIQKPLTEEKLMNVLEHEHTW